MARLGYSDPDLYLGQVGGNGLDRGGEAGVENYGLCIGIFEEVGELCTAIAVVGVDRRDAGLEGGEIGFQILRAIEQIGRDLGFMANPAADKVVGQCIGTGVKLAPGDFARALNQDRTIWGLAGNGFPDICNRPSGHDQPPSVISLGSVHRCGGARVNRHPRTGALGATHGKTPIAARLRPTGLAARS